MAKRQKSEEFKVFADGGGYHPIRRTGAEEARLNEALGVWRREYDQQTGRLLGFRLVGAEIDKVDADLPHIGAPVAISRTVMEVTVEGTRASHTFGLCERDRLQRIKDGKPPEDWAERQLQKARVYGKVGAARGDILTAWPR